MKSVEFDELQLDDLSSVAQALFSGEADPRSRGYKRIHIRPKINWLRVAACCLLPIVLAAGLSVLLRGAGLAAGWCICIGAGLCLLWAALNTKRALICLVQIYQRFAPESIRNKCRFEPSCSQYMILALKKYGLVKGLSKGIDRLRRCNIDNGGFDEP